MNYQLTDPNDDPIDGESYNHFRDALDARRKYGGKQSGVTVEEVN